jgi:cyclic-di-GMP-binding protein
MDNYQRLVEGLAVRVPSNRSHRGAEGAVREAVAALPLANPALAVRELDHILEDMLAAVWSGADRINTLEHLRPAVEGLCSGFERQLGSEPYPLPPASAERAAMAQEIERKMFRGYTLGLHEMCAPAGKLPMFKGKLAATALVRGLVHADRVLMWAYRQYQVPPAGVWLRVHALHAFADTLGLAEQMVEDPLAGGIPLNVQAAYAHVLLLAMSNPYRFSWRQLQDARAVIRCIAGQCALTRLNVRGVVVDTCSDAGPGYIAEERMSDGSGVLSVDTGSVTRIFEERIALLPPGVDTVELPQPGGGTVTTSAGLLRQLMAGWAPAPRGYERLAATHGLDMVVGMHALHYALAGDKDFATFVRQVQGNAITVGQHELTTSWMANADITHPPVFQAEVLDQSEGGYRLCLPVVDGLRMHMGEMVGLAPSVEEPDEQDRDWMVGVIRWLRREGDAVMVGAELLSRHARAAGVRAVIADGERLAPQRGVELFQEPGNAHLSLLVTNLLAHEAVAAEVALPAAASHWNTRASVETWRLQNADALSPACFRMTLVREATEGS